MAASSLLPRALRLVLASALVASVAACAPESADDEAADGNQALANDEVVLEAIPLGERGALEARSLDPKATQASTWRAFLVSKSGSAQSFHVLVAHDAAGRPLYEVALAAEGSEVHIRDTRGVGLSLDAAGRSFRIGAASIDLRAVAADFDIIGRRFSPADAPSTTSSLRPLDVSRGERTCGATIRDALFGAGMALGTGVVALVSCGSIVASMGASAPACAITGWGTWYIGKMTYADAKTAIATCSR